MSLKCISSNMSNKKFIHRMHSSSLSHTSFNGDGNDKKKSWVKWMTIFIFFWNVFLSFDFNTVICACLYNLLLLRTLNNTHTQKTWQDESFLSFFAFPCSTSFFSLILRWIIDLDRNNLGKIIFRDLGQQIIRLDLCGNNSENYIFNDSRGGGKKLSKDN